MDKDILRHEPDRFELREALPYRFEANRREFLEIAGAGLLLVLTLPAQAQRQGGGPVPLASRLHLGEDGTVTVLSGKVEEGQGARTEIALAAAEELGIPVDRVRVLLADTDVVPNDWITAGSRTTPTTVPDVRRACAAARKLLENARQQSGNQALTYADLAKKPDAFKGAVPEGVTLMATGEWTQLGKPKARINANDIVTGAHKYPSDVVRPNMLYAAVLRPPSFGAKLEAADLAAAQKLPGVVAVRDGDFVACAAPTSFAAKKAVQAIQAKWTEKQGPSSTELFSYLKTHAEGNARAQTRGSVEEALKSATRKLAAEYHVAYVQHAPMEPRAAVAEWQNGKLTVWTGSSNPFGVRDQLMETFKLPAERVRVIVPDFGGGFGGKHTGEAAIEAARVAKEAGRPVHLRWTRAEEFTWAYSRPAALIEIRAALDNSGSIAAWDFVNYNSGASGLETPYRSANVTTRYQPCDTPLRQGSYRCLAATANHFAREAFTDELCEAAGKDPLEFRMANLENDRMRNVLAAAAEKFGWKERRAKKRAANHGIGLACGTEKNSVVAACVEVEVDPKTGTPRLLEICEAYECGPILNPAGLRQQVEGAILMGLGAALREEMQFSEGKVLNGRFSRYRVTRFRDMPKMELVLLDREDLEPAGAGETPIVAVAPAMANAIFDATGKRVRSMPLRVS